MRGVPHVGQWRPFNDPYNSKPRLVDLPLPSQIYLIKERKGSFYKGGKVVLEWVAVTAVRSA